MDRKELNDAELDMIVGGTVTANWTASTQSGKLTSNQVNGVYVYDATTAEKVHKFVRSEAQYMTDAEAIETLLNNGWIKLL